MCKCEQEGLTTIVGIEKYKCGFKENENCEECTKIAKIKQGEYFKILQHTK